MRCLTGLLIILVSLPLSAAAQAGSLEDEIAEIHRLDQALAALGGAARAPQLAGRCARLKQAAIDRAIAVYAIDVRAVPTGVHYSPHGRMRDRDGATLVDRDGTLRVQIGDGAFRSAGWLGSTIAHEVEVHVNRQVAKGRRPSPSDEQAAWLDEVEAYDFELASEARFGLRPEESRQVRQRRTVFYRSLAYENRQRVDAGVYAQR